MVSEGNVETLRQVLDGFNKHDLDAIMSHFAEDCVFESPRGPDRCAGAAREVSAAVSVLAAPWTPRP